MRFVFAVSFALVFALQSHAWDLSVGAGVFAEASPYNEVGMLYMPMPVVQFESDYAFFDIQTAGFYLYKSENSVLALIGDYEPLSYDPDDADSFGMKQIEKRKPTVFAGLSYVQWGRFGIVTVQATGDILGRSGGLRGKASYSLYFSPAGIDILPEIGVLWHSDKFNSYYYGVSGSEAAASGYAAYDPGNSFTPYLGLSVQYTFLEHLKVLVSSSYKLLPDDVKSSPIIEKKRTFYVLAGISYIF